MLLGLLTGWWCPSPVSSDTSRPSWAPEQLPRTLQWFLRPAPPSEELNFHFESSFLQGAAAPFTSVLGSVGIFDVLTDASRPDSLCVFSVFCLPGHPLSGSFLNFVSSAGVADLIDTCTHLSALWLVLLLTLMSEHIPGWQFPTPIST